MGGGGDRVQSDFEKGVYMPKYTKGWILMQVLSGLVEVGRFTPGIANAETELDRDIVILLMGHLSGIINKPIEWRRPQPRHGIKVSTVVGYLDEVLNANNGSESS